MTLFADPDRLKTLYRQALTAFQAQRHVEVGRLCREILGLQATHPHALHLMGLASAEMGQRQAAIDSIQRAIAADPTVPEFPVNLARLQLQVGDVAAAEASAHQAITLAPKQALPHRLLGMILLQQQKWEDALPPLRKAQALEPGHADTLGYQATALRQLGRAEDALALLRKAVAANPQMAMAHLALGLMLADLDRVEEAERAFTDAEARAPEAAQVFHAHGAMVRRRGRPDLAEAPLRRALELTPEAPVTRALLVRTLRALDRAEEADAVAAAGPMPTPEQLAALEDSDRDGTTPG